MIKLTERQRYVLSSLTMFAHRAQVLGGPGLTGEEMARAYGRDWHRAVGRKLENLGLIGKTDRGRWVAAEWLSDLPFFAQNNWQRFSPTAARESTR